MNINKAIIMGRLTADTELKTTQVGNSIVRFTVAVNRPKQKDKEQVADFIDCVSFGKTAEFVHNYFRKGSSIIAFGQVQTETYEKDGQKRKSVTLFCEGVQFGESKPLSSEGSFTAKTTSKANAASYGLTEASFEAIADDDLPF